MSTKFYSTNKKSPNVDFFTAILTGQAPDRGLYMPEKIPQLDQESIFKMSKMDYHEIAYTIQELYLDGIPNDELLSRCKDAYKFQPRIESLDARRHLMRLDTGPTASFKDFAAQMMSRLMQYKLKKDEKLLILTATSGDTGSAIAHSFHKLPNIDVLILFPITEVSDNQRKQMTTLGENVQAIAIKGKFDHGQAMVKEAFADPNLQHIKLTSANSINIARLLPQTVYYFWTYSKLAKKPGEEIIFSVPSGNFGDMMGSILAWKMGLPIKKLIVATNANDEFPKLLRTGTYKKIEPSIKCISNAMNVGHPSNLARLIDAFGGMMDEKGSMLKEPNFDEMRNFMFAISADDKLTRQTIKEAWEEENIILEPHGAVAWYGLKKYLDAYPEERKYTCVSLETAHPAKFPEEINKIIGVNPEIPESLSNIDKLEENYDTIDASYKALFNYIKDKY